MKIVIAGAGEVGFHLAKLLSKGDHDITVIDDDEESLEHTANHIDVATIKGKSCSLDVLCEIKMSKVDMFIAVTTFEENNLLTASLAKQLGAKKCIARIIDPKFITRKDFFDFHRLGIDEVISPEQLASQEIKRLLKETAITDKFEFAHGKMSVIGIHLDGKDPLNGKTLAETTNLNPDYDFLTIAILREGKTIIPRGNTRFQVGDHVYYSTLPSGVPKILKLAGKQSEAVSTIMILGGSKIGKNTAMALSKKYRVILLEKDKKKCFELADILPDTLVINGDGRDIELLMDEGIDEVDAFIAVTGNSETNIIACLAAKNKGVNKTIALVENIDFIHLSQGVGIDTMINKKLIAASFISRYVRRGEVKNIAELHGVDVEVTEFEVKENSKVLKGSIKELNIPKTSIIGGVIRKDVPYIPKGDFEFLPKDRVIVASQKDSKCISKVESLFA